MKKRYILILIILFSFFVTNVYASTNTYDRYEADNYGVNKKWEVSNKNLNNVLRTPYVDADEKIYDFADVLTDDEEDKIFDLIEEFKEKTNMELIFLSKDFSYIRDSENEDYAADFYDYNDFGIEDENYSGIIFFRNTNYSDPYYGLYFFGEARLYYSVDRREDILDDIYYDIHNGNYYDGFETLTKELLSYYKKGYASEYKHSYIDDVGDVKEKYHVPWGITVIISGIATAIIMTILIGKNTMIKKEYKANEYLNKESVTYSVKEDRFITSHTSSHTTSSSSSSGSHSSGGGSFGSSGGGHSGGGRHG